MNLEEILKAINSLPNEEKEKAIVALSAPTENPSTAEATVAKEPEVESNKEVIEPTNEEAKEEINSDNAEPVSSTEEVKEEVVDSTDDESVDGNDIPPMTKTGELPEEEVVETQPQEAPVLQDVEGAEMPIDYQQIVDGQNARILALEAENKQLKSKIDGPFGLMSKPSGFGKTNPLYDDTADIPPMKKN